MQLNRRRFLLGAAVAATAAASGLRVQARDFAAGPTARVAPVADTYYGKTVVDPYRWMENAADPDWLPWLHDNDAHARSVLEALPEYAPLQARLRELGAGNTRLSLPYEFGHRLLFLMQAADSTSPVVAVREAGVDRVIFDPGGNVSIEFWTASADGRYLALGLGSGGSEEATIHILDLQTEMLLSERIPRCLAPSPYWLEDGSGFFYTQLGAGLRGTRDYRAGLRCRLHRLGEDPASDRVMLTQNQYETVQVDPHETPVIKTRAGSDWVLAETSTLVSTGLWLARLDDLLAGAPDWQPVFGRHQNVPDHALDGDALWIWGSISDDENAVSRLDLNSAPSLVEMPLATIFGGMINQTTLADDGLYVAVNGGRQSQLFFVPSTGGGQEIPLPLEGAINDLAFGHGRKSAFVHLSTWLEPASIWRVSPSKAPQRLGLTPDSRIDTSNYEVLQLTANARDGVEVPVTLIARRGLTRDGSAPCRVQAYGAYGQSILPDFDSMGVALLERGGIQVIAHVRGGGENGRQWWRDGFGASKPNTWRDLIDVCEHLIADGWTASRRLAIQGGSAGGIAVGRAMTERPDLFGLVCSRVGLLNPLRFEFEANGLANVPEFGSITTEAGFAALYAMDTLHHIVDGVRYPPVLLTHGDNDPRVAVWQTAKTAARLRAAGGPDSGPVLFRVDFNRGHMIDSVEASVEANADLYAWLLSLS